MFRWLTRNDGARMERAKRRLKSPRGSVFSEFAIVMPIALLLCSALYELLGFWDMQVMANHTAWQVGRIAMVRGDDGMEFFAKAGKWSKTGIESKSMPDSLREALKPINDFIKDANRFNNRGNITAMFLMSTCGIGYFGDSPGKTFTDVLTKLVNSGLSAITDKLPEFLSQALVDSILDAIKIPGLSGETGIGKLIAEAITKLLNSIFDAILRPLVNKLAEWFLEFIEKMGLKIDDLFGKGTVAARRGRQIFGAASRIARAKGVTGSEALTVSELSSGNFIFSKNAPSQGRLVYPQVADKETTSDGSFVTGAHGWPPNDQALKLIHVDVSWPFERGWLFPVISGYGNSSTVPVAKGHSIVFTQPNIRCENLLSEGADAYADGDYTNNVPSAYQDIIDDMRSYLRLVRFGMQYRIVIEWIGLQDEDPNPWHSYTPKHCNPLLAYFNGDDTWKEEKKDKYKKGGEYATCWSKITDNNDQDDLMRNLEPYFESGSYRSREYFYWDGSLHKRYRWSGMPGLAGWLENEDKHVHPASLSFVALYAKYAESLKKILAPKMEDLYKAYTDKLSREKLQLGDLARMQNRAGYEVWQENEEKLKTKASVADKGYGLVYSLLVDEINEIGDILSDKGGSYAGDDDDPVFDENDQKALDDPEQAREVAWKKWRDMKEALRKKLLEIDRSMDLLNASYAAYKNGVNDFVQNREKAKKEGFAEACLRIMVKTGDPNILSASRRRNFESAFADKRMLQYDIQAATATMLAKATDYAERIEAAYDRELDYGALLGLKRAKERKKQKEGKSMEEIVGEADEPGSDNPGTLTPGSDKDGSGEHLIDGDNQKYEGGGWRWK